MECSGRTQVRLPGCAEGRAPSASTSATGKLFTTSGTISAITAMASRPGFSVTAHVETPPSCPADLRPARSR